MYILYIHISRMYKVYTYYNMYILIHIIICIYFIYIYHAYGVATSSRLLKSVGLFCKRALLKRRYSAKETYQFQEPTNRSHPIHIFLFAGCRIGKVVTCRMSLVTQSCHMQMSRVIYLKWLLYHMYAAKSRSQRTYIRSGKYWYSPKNTTGWRRPIGCLKLQVSFRKKATNYKLYCEK